jgi:lipid-binding SYLF domain-containing protein
MIKNYLAIVAFVLLVSGCGSNGRESLEERRQAVNDMRAEAIAEIIREYPSVKSKINSAPGYAVFSNANVNLIFASFSGGYGVAHNNNTGKDTYMKMGEAGLGLGLGAKDFRVLMVFKSATALERFVDTGWVFGAQADATAKATDKGAATGAEVVADDIEIYQVTAAGLALQATVKGTKFWKDRALN